MNYSELQLKCGNAATAMRVVVLSTVVCFLATSLLSDIRAGMMAGVSVSVVVGAPVAEDSDDDAMADSWEVDHFGDTTTADETSDFDGDGFSDQFEYRAGTDPKDDGSLLRIEQVELQPDGGIRVVWQSSTNQVPAVRRYDVYWADSMVEFPGGGSAVGTNLTSEGDMSSIHDAAAGLNRRFYRVELSE